MLSMNLMRRGRALEAAIQPLSSAANVLDNEGRTVLHAHVTTNARLQHRVGALASNREHGRLGRLPRADGASWASDLADEIAGETTRRPFGIKVVNVRPVPSHVTTLDEAERYLESRMRSTPDAPAGAVLEGRDGQLALGDLKYESTFPTRDARGATSTDLLAKRAYHDQGVYRLAGLDEWRMATAQSLDLEFDLLDPVSISATERVVVDERMHAGRITTGEAPAIRRLDLTGDVIPTSRDVDPADVPLERRGPVEERRRGAVGFQRWKRTGEERAVTVYPTSAHEHVVHGQPIDPNTPNMMVAFDRTDEGVLSIVGQDGRLRFRRESGAPLT